MNRLPLVSVVVPLHNRAQWLERCLDSVAAQTYRPLEIVVVDNASTDRSWEVAAAWTDDCRKRCVAENDDLQILLLAEALSGACYARNTGCEAAHGEWVAFFDDDDEMSPTFVAEMMTAAHAIPTANWVLTRTQMVFPDGATRVRTTWCELSLVGHVLTAAVSTQSFVARREWLRQIGGWQVVLPCWNDYELGVRMLLADAHPAWCDGVFHRIHQHGESLTAMPMQQKMSAMAMAFNVVAREVQEDLNLSEGERRAVLAALHFRRAWVGADFHAELRSSVASNERASFREVAQCREQEWLALTADALPTPSLAVRWVTRFLRQYTRRGFRGAWRLALLCLGVWRLR